MYHMRSRTTQNSEKQKGIFQVKQGKVSLVKVHLIDYNWMVIICLVSLLAAHTIYMYF